MRSKNLYILIIFWTLDKQVSEDEEEGRAALNSPSPYTDHSTNNEGGIALLDTELPVKKVRKRTACCMCCGLECVGYCLLPILFGLLNFLTVAACSGKRLQLFWDCVLFIMASKPFDGP